eukprot:TRINITY_DN1561_c0_g2_i1.p1 TRINITY_DN1561_c0_g2~~TRINITY_DN1561_c0_g2_i1.p1  ORF type:complete len:1216 (+),score=179.59 TRINITY_DN1561_c0_g2_i1:101-3748(+)
MSESPSAGYVHKWTEAEQVPIEDYDIESLPSGFTRPANIILLSAAVAVIVLLAAAVAVRIKFTGSARLSVLLFVAQMAAALATGTSTWVVTYSASRDAIDHQSVRLLILAGRAASAHTQRDLATGVVALQAMYDEIIDGSLDMTAPAPHMQRFFARIERSLGRTSKTVAAWYMGSERGELQGVRREWKILNDGLEMNTERVVWVGYGPAHCNESRYGNIGSRCAWPAGSMPEMRCPDPRDVSTCTVPACAALDGSCVHCLTKLGTVVDDPSRCPGCRPCAQWQPPQVDRLFLSMDLDTWDLPASLSATPGFCQPAATAAADGAINATQTVYGPRGTPWVGGPDSVMSCSFRYDPRLRPWYNRADKLTWSKIYQFFNPIPGLEVPVAHMGITVTRGIRNPRYRGTPYHGGTPRDPRDNPWLAVLAVDYAFTTLSFFLQSVKPSPNSVILLSDTAGTLVGASEPLTQYVSSITDRDGQRTYEVDSVLSNSFLHRAVILEVVSHFGSFAAAAKASAVIQGADASILSQPIPLDQGPVWIMVIAMPWEDSIADADGATTGALGLAVAISVFAGTVVFFVVRLVLRPLHGLAERMQDVAVMELNVDRVSGGITTEVRLMARDFRVMVQALREYRMYLPEAVLLQRRAEAAEGPVRAPLGSVCIVFTDIVGSTKLWEASPETMSEALLKHDNIIRDLERKHGGYEVKTIGDSFMVAFSDPVKGILFSCHVQERLLEAEWDPDEAMMEASVTWGRKTDAHGCPVWNGITVRIGVSWGQVQNEINPMTDRTDYRGRIVNLAARLEASALTGTVHVSTECAESVSGDARLADIRLLPRPALELRGIGSVQTYFAVSNILLSRTSMLMDGSSPPLYVHRPAPSSQRARGGPGSVASSKGATQVNPLVAADAETPPGSVGDGQGTASDSACTASHASAGSGDRGLRAGPIDPVLASGECATTRSFKTPQLRKASVATVTDLDEQLLLCPRMEPGIAWGTLEANIAKTSYSATRSQGIICYVMADTALVTWNVANPCGEHAQQVLFFAAGLTSTAVRVGIGSGPVHDGRTSGSRNRFVIVVGLAVEVSQAAARAAPEFCTQCLACYVPAPPVGISLVLRPVDSWGYDAGDDEHAILLLEQPQLEHISALKQTWDSFEGSAQPDPVRLLYAEALRQGSVDALQRLRALGEQECDATLLIAVGLLERHVAEHPDGAPYRILAPFRRAGR